MIENDEIWEFECSINNCHELLVAALCALRWDARCLVMRQTRRARRFCPQWGGLLTQLRTEIDPAKLVQSAPFAIRRSVG